MFSIIEFPNEYFDIIWQLQFEYTKNYQETSITGSSVSGNSSAYVITVLQYQRALALINYYQTELERLYTTSNFTPYSTMD